MDVQICDMTGRKSHVSLDSLLCDELCVFGLIHGVQGKLVRWLKLVRDSVNVTFKSRG